MMDIVERYVRWLAIAKSKATLLQRDLDLLNIENFPYKSEVSMCHPSSDDTLQQDWT